MREDRREKKEREMNSSIEAVESAQTDPVASYHIIRKKDNSGICGPCDTKIAPLLYDQLHCCPIAGPFGPRKGPGAMMFLHL